MTQTYQLLPGTYKKVQRKTVLVSAITFVVTIAIFFLANQNDRRYNTVVLPITMVALFAIMTIRLVISSKRQRSVLESYKLTLDENDITCTRQDRSDVSISLTGIVSVSKYKNGLLIKGIDPGSTIIVPSSLDNFDDFIEKISVYAPVVDTPVGFVRKYGPLIFSVLQFSLLVTFNLIKDNTWSIVTGLLLLPFLIRSIIYVHKNKQIPRLSLGILILIAASVTIILLGKITGTNFFYPLINGRK